MFKKIRPNEYNVMLPSDIHRRACDISFETITTSNNENAISKISTDVFKRDIITRLIVDNFLIDREIEESTIVNVSHKDKAFNMVINITSIADVNGVVYNYE